VYCGSDHQELPENKVESKNWSINEEIIMVSKGKKLLKKLKTHNFKTNTL